METAEKIKWVVDPTHSEVHFKVKHLVISTVTGTFKVFSGSLETENENFTNAEIEFSLDVNSVDTNQQQRDEHLRSADFFDAEKFKEIHFTGNTYKQVEAGHYELYGDLTIKEIKKQIKLDVEFGGVIKDPWGNDKAIFNIEGKINRKDWGLNWNAALEAGGFLVSDDVWINCEVQLVKRT